MSELKFFMMPDQLFKILSELAADFDFSIIFRRYENEKHNAEFKNVSFSKELYSLYLKGGYKEIYLSVGDVPKHGDDWTFYEDSSEDLIEIDGSRLEDKTLEISYVRQVTKKSNANKLFRVLSKMLKSKMNCGMSIDKTSYPKMFYSSGLDDYVLVSDIEDKDFIYKIN